MIKLITCDLDGTLFDKNKIISDENIKAIKNLKNAKFVVATGRPIEGAIPVINTLNLNHPGQYTICYNGGLIVENYTQKIIFKKTISGAVVKKIFNEAMELGSNFHAFLSDGTLVTNMKNEYTAVEERINKIEAKVVDINSFDDNEQFIKCMMVSSKERLDDITNKVSQSILDEVNMVRSAKIFLEFLNKDCNKGLALLKLANHLGIKPDETMAIGDAHNDLHMLEVAHIGVAMKNSFECLFDVCNYITDDNESSGVAKAIKHFEVS